MFGVHDIELHYKRGTLQSMCCNICDKRELDIDESVASQIYAAGAPLLALRISILRVLDDWTARFICFITE